jgi:hypothetical protein
MYLLAVAALVLGGCEAQPALDSGGDPCDAVDVTWANWGFGFFASYCRSCHSANSPDRYGAPDGVDFDSLEDVATWAERIRITTIDDQTMPIGGGVPDLELERLDQLLQCGLP